MLDRIGQPRLPEDHQAGAHGYIQLFVGVEGYRVGFLDAPQQVFVRAGEQGGAAPGCIYVEVGTKLRGDVGNGIQRVDVTGLGGAGHTTDGDDLDLLFLQFQAFDPQSVWLDAVELVRLHRYQGAPPQPEYVSGFAQGV